MAGRVMAGGVAGLKTRKPGKAPLPPGARPFYLPPYCLDFNPIENAFAKLNALLRKAVIRSFESLWNIIGHLVGVFTRGLCQLLRRRWYDVA